MHGDTVPVPPEYSATQLVPRPHEDLRPLSVGVVLEVLEGADEGATTEFRIAGDHGRVDCMVGGRANECDIVLRDPSVSTRHFELAFEGSGVRLRDLGSRNGVWLGRARVEEAWLAPGCEFFAGQCRLRVSAIETSNLPVSRNNTLGSLTGASEPSRAMFSLLERIAPTPMTVLVMGETGVGKGEVARTLHAISARPGPFHVLDCSTLPRELSAALVLGHAKGAFTGATTARPGPFEVAEGGTLFLDEIGELPLDVQQNLLTAVDRREIQRVGETTVRKVDVRLIAATNRDLGEEVAAGRFRADLYHRLRQFVVTVPPLRDRPDDVVLLAKTFLEEFSDDIGRPLTLADSAIKQLRRPRWEGNVRQLRDVIRRAAYLASSSQLQANDIVLFDEPVIPKQHVVPKGDPLFEVPGGLQAATTAFQRQYFERALELAAGDFRRLVELIGYSEQGVLKALNRLGLRGRIER